MEQILQPEQIEQLGHVKRPGEKEFISKEEYERRIQEIARCKRDIVYFAETYFRIVSLDKGLEVIKLYPKQKELLQHLIDNNRSVVLASRQTGKTTSYTVFVLWLATFFPEKKIMICANKLQTAIEIMDRIRLAYEYLPNWIKTSISIYNKQEITFNNRSTIRAFATSSSAARGFSANCVTGDTMITVRNKYLPFISNATMTVRSFVDSHCEVLSVSSHDYSENALGIYGQKSQDTRKNFSEAWKVVGPWQVKTAGGWSDISSVAVGRNAKVGELVTEKGKKLCCTYKHIVIDENGHEQYAIDSVGLKIDTVDGPEKVVEYKMTCDTETVFDLSLKEEHVYYTNGILSHNCVIIDEIAFIPQNIISEFFASVMPVISSSKNSKAILVSTPNGTQGIFYEIWTAATQKDKTKNKEGWKPFRIDWWETGGIRNEEWKQQQIATIGIERWRQEFACEFISSGFKKLVPDDIIEKHRMQLSEWKNEGKFQGKEINIFSKDGKKGYQFRMWHGFKPNRTYVAAADVAEGTGSDSSVLQIWDVTDTSQITLCAEFSSDKVSIIEFAFVISQICLVYCNPYLIVEQNGIGVALIEQLHIVYEYPSLVRLGKDNSYGIRSHVQVKSRACLWYREMMTTNGFGFRIYSRSVLEEMGTFVKKDTVSMSVFNALGTAHDDHIMTMIWMTWMLHESIVDKYFVVADTFVSTLGKILPKNIQPQYEYTQEEVMLAMKTEAAYQFETYEEQQQSKFGQIQKQQAAEIAQKKEEIQKAASIDTAVSPKKQVLDVNDPTSFRQEQRTPWGFASGSSGGGSFDWGSGDSWN